MNANQSNVISSLSQAINWITTAFWAETTFPEVTQENIDRAMERINEAIEAINEYQKTINNR